MGLCFYKKKKFIAVNAERHLFLLQQNEANSIFLPFLFQAISCVKKAIWLEPTNFNCLFNLGLIYLTAQQYASAFHTLAAAACIRPDHAECYMLLGSKLKSFLCLFQSAYIIVSICGFIACFVWFRNSVCLRYLNDHGNASLAFERSVMLPDAIKNPQIYLNYAIYCWRMKRLDLAQSNLNNFVSLSEHIPVRYEVRIKFCYD